MTRLRPAPSPTPTAETPATTATTATLRTPTAPIRTPTTPTPSGTTRGEGGLRAALDRCTEPIGSDEFLAEYWERRPLLVQRDEPERFRDLFSTADVERLICETGVRHPAFRLVKAGEQLRPADYTKDIAWRPSAFTGAADVHAVLAEFERGATIVVQALHLHWPLLARFCRELEGHLGHGTQANAYHTPRGSQGLPVHHDTHDVFVLQVEGAKRWLVYEPALELPLKDQRYDASLGEPGEPVLDTTLTAGDTLYLPRGWLHQAVTSDTDSLHLTIGVNVHTWLDALRAALDACRDDVEFRRSVPPDGEPAVDLIERVHARMKPTEVTARARERFLTTRRPILDGQLSQLRALDGLSRKTRLERRGTVLSNLVVEPDAVRLSFEGKQVVFPLPVEPELRFLRAAEGSFDARDLPGTLDDESRLVLIRRLVREGFLAISHADGHDAGSSGSDAVSGA